MPSEWLSETWEKVVEAQGSPYEVWIESDITSAQFKQLLESMSNGGVIYFAPGIYELQDTVYLPGKSFIMFGNGATLKWVGDPYGGLRPNAANDREGILFMRNFKWDTAGNWWWVINPTNDNWGIIWLEQINQVHSSAPQFHLRAASVVVMSSQLRYAYIAGQCCYACSTKFYEQINLFPISRVSNYNQGFCNITLDSCESNTLEIFDFLYSGVAKANISLNSCILNSSSDLIYLGGGISGITLRLTNLKATSATTLFSNSGSGTIDNLFIEGLEAPNITSLGTTDQWTIDKLILKGWYKCPAMGDLIDYANHVSISGVVEI